MVNGVRYGFLGAESVDVGPNVSLVVLSAATLAVVVFDVWLFKEGYGITE
ncbi:MAG: ABC transporter, partial [Halobacteria archaeon]|nr:ABC transporter [Halobacteria archaeon]